MSDLFACTVLCIYLCNSFQFVIRTVRQTIRSKFKFANEIQVDNSNWLYFIHSVPVSGLRANETSFTTLGNSRVVFFNFKTQREREGPRFWARRFPTHSRNSDVLSNDNKNTGKEFFCKVLTTKCLLPVLGKQNFPGFSSI